MYTYSIVQLKNDHFEERCEDIIEDSDENGFYHISEVKEDSKYKFKKEIFSNAGLSHILAISGMHVSFVLLGLQITLKKIGKRSTNIFIIVFLTFFSILTGGSSSVIRAVTMVIISQLAKLLFTKSDTLNNIFFSAVILLIINPLIVYDVGFILSFVRNSWNCFII